ncbi:MAG: hypothetical protein PHV06_04720, partial [bacterium]|nr:hypothetical protein [bacterium]
LLLKLSKESDKLYLEFYEEGEQELAAGNTEAALKNWEEALKIKESSELRKKIVSNSINLGILYYRKEELRKALEIWEFGLKYDKSNKELNDNIKKVKLELEKLENIN